MAGCRPPGRPGADPCGRLVPAARQPDEHPAGMCGRGDHAAVLRHRQALRCAGLRPLRDQRIGVRHDGGHPGARLGEPPLGERHHVDRHPHRVHAADQRTRRAAVDAHRHRRSCRGDQRHHVPRDRYRLPAHRARGRRRQDVRPLERRPAGHRHPGDPAGARRRTRHRQPAGGRVPEHGGPVRLVQPGPCVLREPRRAQQGEAAGRRSRRSGRARLADRRSLLLDRQRQR